MGIVAVEHDRDWLKVHFADRTTHRFLGTWLRDNIKTGRHRDAGQRTFDINSLPETTIAGARLDSDTVTVTFAPEGPDATFDAAWFRLHGSTNGTGTGVTPRPTLWSAEQQGSLEFADYPTLVGDPARLHDWLVGIRDLGFGLLENLPAAPGSILKAVDLFGYVRETNYGRIFEVRDEPDPANLAFTRLEIGMHTDNPYRDPVPGLQILHCLVNDSDGGHNRLADGFAVVERIRRDHPEAFDLLTTRPVRFRYLDGDSADLQAYKPLIELDTGGRVTCIRYNSRSAQAFDMPAGVIDDYYRAYRILGKLLHEPGNRIEFRLRPGQLMTLDNQRVLHGRTAYTTGARHLQGCYADKDSLYSRIRVLEAS
ncbi:MAG: TauD/TfdA family dioxygenase [Actinomycetota bacterium]|nr:TauD/TfdA family dioxygenase [Actinomycetota bacterium]